jgi:hypothetical protein
MTRRLPVAPSPGPLEEYAAGFDDLFRARAQRDGFRRYLEGLLLPAERNKTLTALANTEPVAGAQRLPKRRACNGSFPNPVGTRGRSTNAALSSCSKTPRPPRTGRACWS